MRHVRAVALGAALILATAGCAAIGGGGSSVNFDDAGGVVIDGRRNDPIGEKVEAGRFDSPAGEFVIVTYDSEVGPCYDLRYPGDRVEAGCQAVTGIHPGRPVTGRPDRGSMYAINGRSFNYGSVNPGRLGVVHHGIAHPTVAEVRVEAGDGQTLTFPTAAAPNVDGLHVFFAYAPTGWDGYQLVAYDADGCRLEARTVTVTGRPGSEQPQDGDLPARHC